MSGVPGIPAARYRDRLATAREALRGAGGALLLVGPGADLRWLTGYDAMLTERLTMLALPVDGSALLLVPRLERSGAARAPAIRSRQVGLASWEETEDPLALIAAAGGQAARDPGSRVLVGDRLWASFVLGLQAFLPGARFGLATSALSELRTMKDADEVRLLREAAAAADRTVLAIAAGRLVGRSEVEIGREVRDRLVDEGHDEAAFAIVGSGPNSAEPHHAVSARVVAPGEPIVLDIGGTLQGYCSDTTRTLWVTGRDPAKGPDDAFRHLYTVLEAAQAAAVEAVKPGIACEALDTAARQPIDAAGFGEAFLHRTGHGIGLEVHEDPYLVAGNHELLRPGHAFSVEPGIYLEGRYGARIEDIVVCAQDGPDALNLTPRSLMVVGG
jgi:Xaa-Pro aminopeptidase